MDDLAGVGRGAAPAATRNVALGGSNTNGARGGAIGWEPDFDGRRLIRFGINHPRLFCLRPWQATQDKGMSYLRISLVGTGQISLVGVWSACPAPPGQ